jgi:hypothetical protein
MLNILPRFVPPLLELPLKVAVWHREYKCETPAQMLGFLFWFAQVLRTWRNKFEFH